MKRVAALVLVIGLMACASIQRATNHDGMSSEDQREAVRAKKAEKEKAEAEKQEREVDREKTLEARAAVLVPGAAIEDFKKAWGAEDKQEYDKGTWILTFDRGEEPLVASFKNGKLISFLYDKETGRERREQRKRSLGAGQRSCTSTRVGSTVYTNCY